MGMTGTTSLTSKGRLLAGIVLAAGAAASFQLPQGAQAIAQSTPITFEVPRVGDPIHTYGEPDIGLRPNVGLPVTQPSNLTTGEVYISGPQGTGTQRSVWQGSVDGGHTFRTITRSPPDASGTCGTVTVLCGPLAGPGGGDTEIAFDKTGKQYFADLWALACQHVATRVVNNNGTETVTESPAGGCPVPGSDRQWIVVKDSEINTGPPPYVGESATPPLVYMESNSVAGCNTNGGGAWYRSIDGLTWASAEPGESGGVLNDYCPFGADGYPSIDQATGKVFQAEYGTVNSGDAIVLNIGKPVNTAGDLCFLDHPLTQTGCLEQPSGLVTVAVNDSSKNDVINNSGDAANFMVSSLDQGRNLWVVWVVKSTTPAQRQVWVSVAPPDSSAHSCTSCWMDWATPVRVSAPPANSNIFPWIQAGSAGRADIAWYGDTTVADPSDTSVHHVWNVYMSQVVYPLLQALAPTRIATTNSTPVNIHAVPQVTQVTVTPHPMDLEDVCLAGTACIAQVGNRNLADFFEIRTDDTGAAMIVYNDMSNGLCQNSAFCSSPLDHPGASVVTIARQRSGPGIYTDPSTDQPFETTGPSNAPISGLADAPTDALFPVFGGGNIPSMDIVDSRLSTSGQTLTITTKLAGDPRTLSDATTATNCQAALCQTQLVTRWQMGNTLYYGMLEVSQNGLAAYGGTVQSIDDCSVSACDPHVLVYPDLTGTSQAPPEITCPATPSKDNPCIVILKVNLGDIGNPTNANLFEEVGTYTFINSTFQSLETQATERADNAALEIDGVCCWNFQGAGIVAPSPTPGVSPTPSGGPNTSAGRPLPPAPVGIVLPASIVLALALAWPRKRRQLPDR